MQKLIVNFRKNFLAPSLSTFQAYDNPLILKKGKMQYIWDFNNKKYIDLLGQNLCISVGHCHPKVVNAATTQLKTLSHCTTMYHHKEPSYLAKELVEKLPGDDWVVHLVNSGSEAVDLAVQMARVYTSRNEIIGLYKGYHGLHGQAAGLTAIGKATQPCYSTMFNSIKHVAPNSLDQLEDYLKYGTGGKIAGMIIEPLQGYGGIHPLDKDYMKEAFKLVRKHGGVAISDEVQTGFGRCGESFWGFEMEHNGAVPDMITVAKGMGNGVGIIGAVICKKEIAQAFTTKMFFNTYGSNPVAAAAARAVLKVIDDDKVIENCKSQGDYFKKELQRLCDTLPSIYKEVRGTGLFQGLEINGYTEEQSQYNAYYMHKELLNYGVIIGRGSAAGNVFRIQPPMCINREDVKHVIDSLEDVGRQYLKTNSLNFI